MLRPNKRKAYIPYGESSLPINRIPFQEHGMMQPSPFLHYPNGNPYHYSQQMANPYYYNHEQGFHPHLQNYDPYYQGMSSHSHHAQSLFQNPLQPNDEKDPFHYQQMEGYQNLNPYPQHNMIQKQPGGLNSIVNSFKSQDGTIDFNKMMNTAGSMMNAVNQVSSLVKGFSSIFKASG
ncbi:YppG family protein [Bacillus aquiflavi]|nr:YppG family protein [Bacillus aquiflavi]